MSAPASASPERPGKVRNLADGRWHRMHPLSPLIRSWSVVVLVLVYGAQNWGDNVASGNGGGLPELRRPDLPTAVLAAVTAGIVLVVLLVIGFLVLSWRMTRFRVADDALELYHGVLFRQHRRARLDRLQTVDVAQPLLARLTGLARLNMEVAGGSGSGIKLSFLREGEAQALRNHLIAEAAGVHYAAGAPAPEAPERQALEVPITRLMGSLLLSGAALAAFVIGVALVVVSVLARDAGPVVGVFPVFVGVVSLLWGRFNGGFGFRVATSPDGLRLRHGLLEQRSQTVPPGRVQAIRLSQGLLWRTRDWWSVKANIAGYSGREGNDTRDESGHTLLPVGSRYDAVAVLALVLPDLGVEDGENPWTVIDLGLTGSGPRPGYLSAPRRARAVDPISWRRTGVRVTREALLISRGVFHRTLDIVPHARTQSLGLTQGPVQRRMDVASFVLHSTRGPVTPAVPHLDAADAARLLADQSIRAEGARAASGPERWMESTVPEGYLTPSAAVRREQLLGAAEQELEQPPEAAEPADVQEFAPPDAER